ncbi:hypothetical protein [Salipiger abyssi]|uniref:hypothetical protein n=1 Tax=Salipiger abyssi TaxID=1250539 RepID=UPI00405862BC
MKRSVAATVLTVLSLMSGAVQADPAERLADILAWDYVTPEGQLASRKTASFEGCVLKLTVDKLDACSKGASFGRTDTYIDIRVLKADRADVEHSRPARPFPGAPGAGLVYAYRWAYNRLLKVANATGDRIFDEEFRKYPKDAASRLESLSDRYREEIDPRSYSRSRKTVSYCSGAELTAPLRASSVTFFMAPENTDEFIDLLGEYALNCEAAYQG